MTAPEYMTPDDFAKHFGWSPRRVRDMARKIGACRIVGNRMILIQSDIDALLEATKPCLSPSTSAEKSGTIAERSKGKDFAELLALREKMKQGENLPKSHVGNTRR